MKLFYFLCLSVLPALASPSDREAVDLVRSVMQRTTPIKARYLDPSVHLEGRRPDDEIFVVCEADITTAEEIKKITDAIISGIEGGPEIVPLCWDPRHAIVIPGEPEVGITICYECQQGKVRVGKKSVSFSTAQEPEGAIDRIFTLHGMKKAKDPRPNQPPQPTPSGRG